MPRLNRVFLNGLLLFNAALILGVGSVLAVNEVTVLPAKGGSEAERLPNFQQ
jgi:hypothetical protein